MSGYPMSRRHFS